MRVDIDTGRASFSSLGTRETYTQTPHIHERFVINIHRLSPPQEHPDLDVSFWGSLAQNKPDNAYVLLNALARAALNVPKLDASVYGRIQSINLEAAQVFAMHGIMSELPDDLGFLGAKGVADALGASWKGLAADHDKTVCAGRDKTAQQTISGEDNLLKRRLNGRRGMALRWRAFTATSVLLRGFILRRGSSGSV